MRCIKISGQQSPSRYSFNMSGRSETDGFYSSFFPILVLSFYFLGWNLQSVMYISSFLSWCWFSFLKWNLKRGKVQLHFFEHCISWCAKYIFSSHSSFFWASFWSAGCLATAAAFLAAKTACLSGLAECRSKEFRTNWTKIRWPLSSIFLYNLFPETCS